MSFSPTHYGFMRQAVEAGGGMDLNYSFGRPETANECHLGLITPREPSRDGKR